MNKRYEIILSQQDGLWSAFCKELCVNGVGQTKEDAIEMLVITMRSTLAADAAVLKEDPSNIERLASFLTRATAAA